MNQRQQNLFNNLVSQIKRIKKENIRQGSAGRDRYETSQRKFAEHLAKKYGSQNFRNIKDKHIESFLKERIEHDDVTLSTIKNDLSAIRKLHANVNAKNKISENDKFKNILDTAKINAANNEVDRAWTEDEYKKGLNVAENMQRNDVSNAMKIGREFGLRVHEATFLTKQDLRDALKNNYLHLKKTKNAIKRDVPIENTRQRETLQEVLENTKNERIFITHNQTHQSATESIKDWIYNNRDKFTEDIPKVEDGLFNYLFDNKDERKKANLTFHGLRHKYAREQYNKYTKDGLTKKQAKIQVSHRLGHGRDEVTNIYL